MSNKKNKIITEVNTRWRIFYAVRLSREKKIPFTGNFTVGRYAFLTRCLCGLLIKWAIIAATLFSTAATSEEQKRYRLDIPSQNVETALAQLAAQTELMLLFPYDPVVPMSSTAVKGLYTVPGALKVMLQGTALKGSLTQGGVITISAFNNTEGIISMNSKRKLLASTVAFFMGAGAGGVMAQETTDGEGMDWLLEEVVVTAQKREQNLNDVPISIKVLGGDKLDSGRFESINEAINQVAGVSLDSGFQGGGTAISIRGVSPNGPLFKGSATVGYYLDEISYGLIRSAVAPNPSAYDMGRVEVLRGPQGTLYGASALNGVVRLVTMDANLDEVEFKTRGLFSSTKGGGDNARGDMALSVPLIPGKLAARLVLGYSDLGGWIDKPNRNEGDANETQLSSQRLKINAAPTEGLAVELTVSRSRNDADAPSTALDDGTSTAVFEEPVSTDLDSSGLIVEYDFTHFSLLSATSYLDYSNVGLLDVVEALELQTNIIGKVLSQEIRLNSSLEGSWQWSMGVSYREAEEKLFQDLPGVLARPLNFIDESKSSAIFGEVTKSFNDGEYELTMGLRYFEDEVSYNDITLFDLNTELFSSNSTFDATTPRVVLTWYPNEDLTAYASYSQGFRSGFEQNVLVKQTVPDFAALGEDLLTNYEIGAKGNLWNGRLNFDVALYYISWDDTQQSVGVPIGDAGVTVVAPINSGAMSGAGIDIGINAQLTEHLQMGLTFGQNDLTFEDEVFSSGVAVFSKGERGNTSPETTAGITADYLFPLGVNGYEGRFSGSVNYQSERVVKDVPGGVLVARKGDSLTQARLSFAVDSPDKWTLTAYVDNATNEDGKVLEGELPNWTSRVRPRTVGLQVEYKY